MTKMIDIQGLDKVEVLTALFNSAVFHPERTDPYDTSVMTPAEAARIIEHKGLDFDWMDGRSLKVDLSGDSFDARLYDRDNGEGKAEQAVDQIKAKKAHMAAQSAQRVFKKKIRNTLKP